TSDQDVATVSLDDAAGVPIVRASAAGVATLTLVRDGLSAQVVATVLAADAVPPDGTTLWTLKPTPNPQPAVTQGIREVVRAVPVFVGDNSLVLVPALYFIEHGPYYMNQDTTVLPTVIRA